MHFSSFFEIQHSIQDSTSDRITVCRGTWETCERPDNMWVCLKIHDLKIPCLSAQFQFFQRDISFLLAKLRETTVFSRPILAHEQCNHFLERTSAVSSLKNQRGRQLFDEDPHLITLVQFWSLARDAGILTSGTWVTKLMCCCKGPGSTPKTLMDWIEYTWNLLLMLQKSGDGSLFQYLPGFLIYIQTVVGNGISSIKT